jgi:hypothetical protein
VKGTRASVMRASPSLSLPVSSGDSNMNNLIKRVEVFSNVAIIIVALLLSAVLVKNYLLPRPAQANVGAATKGLVNTGAKLSLRDVDWSQSDQTLVLALSNSCHFCSESGPFYQRLAQSKGGTRLIAVLPQPVEDGQKYLDKLHVPVSEVRQLTLSDLGVEGTPTLLLVDKSGTVKNVWVGRLQIEQEAAVLEALQGRS